MLLVAAVALSGRRIYHRDHPVYIGTAHADEACHMLRWAPTSWQAWYQLGRQSVRAGTPLAMDFGEKCMTYATRLDPNNYLLWERVALVRFKLGDTAGGRRAFAALEGLRKWKANQLRQHLKKLGLLPPNL
jgi:hypothetical protein